MKSSPRTRAKNAGRKFYRPTHACKRCGTRKRYTDGHACVKCQARRKHNHSRAWRANERAQRYNVVGEITSHDINRVFDAQDGCCGNCRSAFVDNRYVIDHRVPMSIGGPDFIGNVWTLCVPCNKEKTKRDYRLIRNDRVETERENGVKQIA